MYKLKDLHPTILSGLLKQSPETHQSYSLPWLTPGLQLLTVGDLGISCRDTWSSGTPAWLLRASRAAERASSCSLGIVIWEMVTMVSP